jgi:tRNA pseudouridine32 synthase/23S rRNA pseudouridine746 synthase
MSRDPRPLRDGVGASRVRLPAGDWPTVHAFLCAHFPAIDAAQWRSRMARGLVTDEHGHPIAENTPYRIGATVHYYRELPPEPRIPFEAAILHRDERLLVVDKPHFLPVLPAGRFLQETLLVRLKRELGIDDLAPLHRIDRGTAGVIVFSLDARTRDAYQALFRERRIEKTYEAIAPELPALDFPRVHRSRLEPGKPFFRMTERPGVPNSETRIEVIETHGGFTRYRLFPVTGRKHQLRVHLAALGAPIVDDPLYPTLRPELEDDYARPLRLLARAIAFTDPVDSQPRRYESRRELDDATRD